MILDELPWLAEQDEQFDGALQAAWDRLLASKPVLHARRGRPDAAFRLVERRWPAWRGRAVEPLVRQSLELAAASGVLPWPQVEAVGGWWNRQFDPKVDLVGADRRPVAQRLHFVGSIKWDGTTFDRHDLSELTRAAVHVPGFLPSATALAVVTLASTYPDLDLRSVDLAWGPADLLAAWPAAR